MIGFFLQILYICRNLVSLNKQTRRFLMAALVGSGRSDMQYLQKLNPAEREVLIEDMDALQGRMDKLTVRFQKEAKVEVLRQESKDLKEELKKNNEEQQALDAKIAAMRAKIAAKNAAKNAAKKT